MTNSKINILYLIPAIISLFWFWIFFYSLWIFFYSSEKTAEMPHCWVESYPVKKLLRQVSWYDKAFVHDVNVHNAYEISEGDMDFVLTVEAESKFDPEAVGDSWNSHWFCQWHRRWQSETLDNPNFKDPVWQMEECFKYYTEVFNNWTISNRLYWYRVRHLVKDRFKFETEWKLRRTCES